MCLPDAHFVFKGQVGDVTIKTYSVKYSTEEGRKIPKKKKKNKKSIGNPFCWSKSLACLVLRTRKHRLYVN